MDFSKLLNCVLTLGADMLISGAEVSRVEDTIQRIGAAYGMEQVDVFTITSSIIVTVRIPKGGYLTQTKRIHKYKTDFTKLEALNALSREVCADCPNPAYFETRLDETARSYHYPEPVMYFAYALMSAAFSVFFGGDAFDAVTAALVGLLIRRVLTLCRKIDMNYIITNFLCSMTGGLGAVLLLSIGIGTSIDKILIGNIMLLIPGIALTNAIRDMISGDIMSGMLRLSEAVLVAIAIAVGFTLTLLFTGV